MDRKQWLETFLKLADTGAPVVAYRRHLHLKTNVIKLHVGRISAYRKELADIVAKEKEDDRAAEERAANTTRKRELESRLQEQDTGVTYRDTNVVTYRGDENESIKEAKEAEDRETLGL